MKVVHINNIDLMGDRFNGHDMQIHLNKNGVSAKQFVMQKLGEDPNTIALTKPLEEPTLQVFLQKAEQELSIQSMLYPYGWRLFEHPDFKDADIAHYHLIHNHFISLAMFPELVHAKPSVLTVHDAWLVSGHCVHSLGCSNWQTECGNCPHLSVSFAMQADRTREMWNFKKKIFANLPLDLVVASSYMRNIVQKSPITSHLNTHFIPFGIDLSLFVGQKDRTAIRKGLKIPEENFVLFFRATPLPFKGLPLIKQMLSILKPTKPVTLLAVGNKDLLSEFEDKYQVVDFAWVTDAALLAELYCASDVFLMPSTAEAFGLMAIEAMASSRPIIVLEGTALPGVTFAPECGIALEKEDPAAFASVIERLMAHPAECEIRGQKGRELAEKHYRFEDYVKRHVALYEEMLQ